ncbi:MAG: hypothetical protein KAT66_00310 [Candidatus Lokiarchaeota archaeon]|nr:hypothetical protein [Candidatus Lokiarchaeota archaeon]
MKKNAKVSLFVILLGFSMVLIGILLLFIAINWWEVMFVQVLHGLIYVLTSILLVSTGIYLIARYIT